MKRHRLQALLAEAEISQSDFARGISKNRSVVCRLISGELDPSKQTIDAALAFLSKKLRRRVTYEQILSDEPVGARGRR